MGKYLPVEARPVTAFQWKSTIPSSVHELINYLVNEGHNFELFPIKNTVSIIVGYDTEDQVRVDHSEWIVFDGTEISTYDTTSFFAKYQAGPSS